MINVFLGQFILYCNLLLIISLNISSHIIKKKPSKGFFFAIPFLLTLSIINLLYGFITANYFLKIVSYNSHQLLPLIYKVTAIWGNHEGSLLFLIWMISLIGGIFYNSLNNQACKILLLIILLLNLFLTIISNPFTLNQEIIKTGRGFNPLLQDIGIAFHPPLLYLGNALQIIIFCLCSSPSNYQEINKLNKISWSLLTCGIALGSWWAYRELGWGGIWFWDPVENISLLPWLTSTALLHYNRNYHNNALLYKILASTGTIAFFYGMLIVRSGLINSVHSFAFDLNIGLYLFAFLMILLFIATINLLKEKTIYKKLKLNSIETGILFNNILLLSIFIIILISTIYPVIAKLLLNKDITIKEGFFLSTISPIVAVIVILCSIYSHLLLKKQFLLFLLLSNITIFLVYLVNKYYPLQSFFSITILFGTILLSFYSLIIFFFRKNTCMAIGHFGFALLLFSIICHYEWSFTKKFPLIPGEVKKIANFKIELLTNDYKKQDNFLARKATLKITDHQDKVFFLYPELRFFPIEKQFTVESTTHIYKIFNDFYLTIGNLNDKGLLIEFKYQAFINLIWISVLVMGISGILSYFKNKKRHELSS